MWSPDLAMLRQNWLLTESAFLSFARDRGLGVGAIKGEPTRKLAGHQKRPGVRRPLQQNLRPAQLTQRQSLGKSTGRLGP